MADRRERRSDSVASVPGTVLLQNLHQFSNGVALHPVPSADPNEGLNWSNRRKTVNFSLAMIYVLLTFTQLDIGFTAWGQYQDELGLSTNQLNNATALNYAGLAVGSFVFVPLMHKYGRRPLYLFSTVLQLASCIWLALAKTQADILLSSAMSGLGGAICETIVQVTISDLFFVHQHAAMNAYYLLFTGAGAFLGPVAAGYVVNSQGWRWIWWWCVILFGVNLLLVFFFFEESKHISVIRDQEVDRSDQTARVIHHKMNDTSSSVNRAEDEAAINYAQSPARPDDGIPLKSYRERMALTTCTGGSIFRTMHKPFPLLFTFPVIAFTALTYGSLLAVFAILTSVQAIYLFNAPYNFSAAGVGLMNIAPFIGTLPGVFIGGWLNDRSIIWLSRRNSGIYEPEMRLWFTLPFTVIAPAGVIMMGVGLSKGAAWPVLAVGFGLFGFSLTAVSSIVLSYAMDCYHDIIGTAMVSIIFMRNALSVVILFALTPWIESMGIQNVHILTAAVLFIILVGSLLLLRWGKKSRASTAHAYERIAEQLPDHRLF